MSNTAVFDLMAAGFKPLKEPNMFMLELDYNRSERITDTTISVKVIDGLVTRVGLFTDKEGSDSAYYVSTVLPSTSIQCNEKFLAELYEASKMVSRGRHQKWKELFNETPVMRP